ncbi:MAG: ABC transporter permease [Bdellovibrionaceae bacterium]|nr:ABC transporter permease [Pseudobdellovibrionaceae bacterium]
MLSLLSSAAKPFFDLTFKFLINFHLLLIIIFTIFYFVPGAYIDDEHFVENTSVAGAVADKPDFFFSVKDSLKAFYSLDFGMAYHNRNSKVIDIVWKKASYSFRYLSTSILVLFFFSILISFFIVRSKNRRHFLLFFRGLNQIPQLVLIPVVIYFFSYAFSIVPLRFDPNSRSSYCFVIFVLLIKPMGQLIHLMVERWHREKSETYVQFARAKGLSNNRILFVHMFKNIANSFLGYFLTIVLQLLTGNFILESLYSIPGFGLGFMDSVSQRDLPLVVGYLFLFSSLYLTLHFSVQIVFMYLNPKLRESE